MNRQHLLLLGALLLLAATFLQPRFTLTQASYRYVYVFDISQSMNVADVLPINQSISQKIQSRLEVAKRAAQTSVANLPCGTEVGVALFTGHRVFLLMNPVETCKNQHDINNTISMVDWRSTWEAKSEIAKGMYKSIRLMKQIGANTRVVFFTDGHEAPPVNPAQLPRFSGKVGEVKGLIIGLGGDKLVPIPRIDRESGKQSGVWQANEVVHVDVYNQEKYKRDGVKMPVGFEHMSSLRESYLQSLAAKTGLNYHRLRQPQQLIVPLTDATLSHPTKQLSDARWLFALAALLVFITLYLSQWQRKNEA